MKLIKKGKKKKGFTLIELIAVIAIIGILAAVLAPKILGYMEDAKKSKVIAQARTAVMALETYNAKSGIKLDDSNKISKLVTESGDKYKDYYDLSTIDRIDHETAISVCKQIADGAEFTIDADGKFSALSKPITPGNGTDGN